MSSEQLLALVLWTCFATSVVSPTVLESYQDSCPLLLHDLWKYNQCVQGDVGIETMVFLLQVKHSDSTHCPQCGVWPSMRTCCLEMAKVTPPVLLPERLNLFKGKWYFFALYHVEFSLVGILHLMNRKTLTGLWVCMHLRALWWIMWPRQTCQIY